MGCDAAQGVRLVVDHLISVHGHTKIDRIMGNDSRASADGREQGWQTALRSARLATTARG